MAAAAAPAKRVLPSALGSFRQPRARLTLRSRSPHLNFSALLLSVLAVPVNHGGAPDHTSRTPQKSLRICQGGHLHPEHCDHPTSSNLIFIKDKNFHLFCSPLYSQCLGQCRREMRKRWERGLPGPEVRKSHEPRVEQKGKIKRQGFSCEDPWQLYCIIQMSLSKFETAGNKCMPETERNCFNSSFYFWTTVTVEVYPSPRLKPAWSWLSCVKLTRCV
ncbi:uncharacterized protein LOC116631374 [Phoca vitulina]|uniref:uncharacterized protein LOC116631374 n=1 Tax=Phoca vitulina TaxID=9720 RepID=UPI001395D2D7|nr:uncharacterized protein LOC116631374 [Phoca vitulina]